MINGLFELIRLRLFDLLSDRLSNPNVSVRGFLVTLCLIIPIAFLPAISAALTLGEGLKIVTENGRDVMISRTAEEQAAQGISAERSRLLPSVNAFARQTWLAYMPQAVFGSQTVPVSQKDYPSFGVSVNETLYDFGKNYSNLMASRYGYMASQAGTARTRNTVALEFILTYIDLLESEKGVDVAKKEVENLQAHLKDTEALYSEGMITKNDVLQAEVVLAESQQRLINVQNARDLQASRINTLLMRPLNQEVTAEEIGLKKYETVSLQDAWKMAEEDRPELKIAEAVVKQKQEEIGSYKAEYFPTVYVSGGYAYEQNRYMAHNDNWSLIAGLNVNLFSGGLTHAKVRRAEAELRGLELSLSKLLDGVKLDVKSAYLEIQSAAQRLDVAEKAVAQADENLRLQKIRYQEGVATATDLLDAVFLKSRADTNYWNGVYGVGRANAKFGYATGRDLVALYSQIED